MNLPGSQAEQPPRPSLWKPGPQTHSIAPAEELAWVGHSRHALAPEALTNLPASQARQRCALGVIEYDPAWHGVQEVRAEISQRYANVVEQKSSSQHSEPHNPIVPQS